MSQFLPAAKTSELSDPGKLLVEVGDRLVVLFLVAGEYYAIDDICTHDDGPLSDGMLDNHQIACPRHGAKFDIRDGKAISMPAIKPTRGYEVKVEGDEVFIKLNTGLQEAAPSTEDSKTPIDEQAVRDKLKERVIDPELFVNIVDLGLIYGVEIEEVDGRSNVSIDMTLTSPACPAGPQLVQQAKTAIAELPGAGEVTLNLVMTPPWTPDQMTDDARDHLGIF